MGSISHPRCYDPAAMIEIKAAFHEVWDSVILHAPLRDHTDDRNLQAQIIRQLLDLAADGTTSRKELKAEVLRKLPPLGAKKRTHPSGRC